MVVFVCVQRKLSLASDLFSIVQVGHFLVGGGRKGGVGESPGCTQVCVCVFLFFF